MLKLLFIEDQPEAVQPVINSLKRKTECDYACEIAGFNDAETVIDSFVPDVVILDLLENGGSAEPKTTGLATYDQIWNTRFCPIVVYSARPDILSEAHDEHPFVKIVQKGKDSEVKVEKSINELRPQIEAIRDAETRIRREFAVALRDVAPDAFRMFTDAAQRNDAILRSGRRRLAACMDTPLKPGEQLASWELYLCPPISGDIQLGDILRQSDGPVDDACSFCVVLTPSCDLVASGGRKPKVKNVLVSGCCSLPDALTRLQMVPKKGTLTNGEKLEAFKKQLRQAVLTPGYCKPFIPFPYLEKRIPAMAADLRHLKFIPIGDIARSGKAFDRIASIDSPFRELVSWAYLHTACRPGLPDRDFDSWCDDIIDLLRGDNGAVGQ